MLIVHHLGISQSDRIVWLCEELGIPYELRRYERDPVTRLAPAEYKALHPFGTAPVITDGDLVLGESAAIIEYIIGRYSDGALIPGPADAGFADYLFWFHFANGSMMPAGMVELVAGMLAGPAGAGNPIIASLRERGDRAFAMVDQRLGEAPYFAGDRFTAADIVMLFPLAKMRSFTPRDISGYANIRAYLDRIAARPAFVSAMEKADPGVPAIPA